jgi:hypothetical protein
VQLELGAVVNRDGAGREDPFAFTLTKAQLAEMIENAVATAMRAAANDVTPELLDRNGIAKVIGCSAAQIDKLRKCGMPCERVGQTPRFRAKDCLAWIHDQKWKS